MRDREKMLEQSKTCLESQIRYRAAEIKEVLVNRELYNYLRMKTSGIEAYPMPSVLSYRCFTYEIPLLPDDAICTWKFIFKKKELDKMNKQQLDNVTMNGFALTWSEVYVENYRVSSDGIMERHEGEVVITALSSDRFTLLGLTHGLMESNVTITVKGNLKGQPWNLVTIEAVIDERNYSTHHPTGEQQLDTMTLGVRTLIESIDEDLLPKVKLEVTEKDAAYLQALILKDKNGGTEAWKDTLAQYIRSQSKAVQG